VPSVLIVILSWVLWFNTRVNHTSQHPGAPHSTTHHNASLSTTLSALHVILSWVLWFNTRVNHTSQNPGAPHSTTRHHVVGLVVQHSGKPHTHPGAPHSTARHPVVGLVVQHSGKPDITTSRRSSQHYTPSCRGSPSGSMSTRRRHASPSVC